jgi:hypothetical protein
MGSQLRPAGARRPFGRLVLASLVLVAQVALGEGLQPEWEPRRAPLMTRWAADVTADDAHPEYPRPHLRRDDWLNLNGLWDYALRPDVAPPLDFDGRILVPYPVESALSGVMRRADGHYLWYRRSFDVPPDWTAERVLLHFGAVDWEASVWINGQAVGVHRGGYDPFTFDVTEALAGVGSNELLVRVWDPTDGGSQPSGKQMTRPHGIWYTPTTGIWQTVWLEGVPSLHVEGLRLEPDLDASLLRLVVNVGEAGSLRGSRAATVRATALADGAPVAEADGIPGEALHLRLSEPRLWSPDSPFLYDLHVELLEGDRVVDRVESYFGMRSIALGHDEHGVTRLFLNGEALFQYGTLDQGYWPDGLYTAPSDEALRYDLEVIRDLGFNLVRKHVKVESARWYYWADRLGLLVWQDMPNGGAHVGFGQGEAYRSPASAAQFELELRRVVDALHHHPSIVMWVIFNEGWGQYDTARLTEWLESHDPTRLVNGASGWNDMGSGAVHDVHAYPGPAAPPRESARAAVLGEFGGLGLPLTGHTWHDEGNWGYRSYHDPETLTEAYLELVSALRGLTGEAGLAAAVYTQTSDVEIEVNGLMTYDRALVKMDAARVRAANERLYLPPPLPLALVATSERDGQSWRATTSEPDGDWTAVEFDDDDWTEAPGGFGTSEVRGSVVRTPWRTPGIWLRQSFELDVDPAALEALRFRVHHDEDVDIYLNGAYLLSLPYYTFGYVDVHRDELIRSALRLGRNVLAVHARRTWGGQYIDIGLYGYVADPPSGR